MRIGKIRVTTEFLVGVPNFRTVLRDMGISILDRTVCGFTDIVTFICTGDDFEPLDGMGIIPRYELVIKDDCMDKLCFGLNKCID